MGAAPGSAAVGVSGLVWVRPLAVLAEVEGWGKTAACRSGKPSGHVHCAWAIHGEKFQNFGLNLTACQYKVVSILSSFLIQSYLGSVWLGCDCEKSCCGL